jgi:hypothetical protein
MSRKFKATDAPVERAVPRYRTQKVLRVKEEHVQHIIRHLTCACGYTALDLLKAGRSDEVQIVLPNGAPDDGQPTKHLISIHTICERPFNWDEYVNHKI